jgi:hypothetical protein
MELRNEIVIDAPASTVWQVLGERFMDIGDWAAPITSSCPVAEARPAVGVARACYVAGFGPVKAGTIIERLTVFNREGMFFEYEALDGMPRFVARAVNRWSAHAIADGRCLVRIHATLTLRGPVALFGCLVKSQMQSGGKRVAEELKYYVEQGKVHPRKLASAAPK